MAYNFGEQQQIKHRNNAEILVKDTPCYVANIKLHYDLCVKSVVDEISERTKAYRKRITKHPNILAVNLMNTQTVPRRLNRKIP